MGLGFRVFREFREFRELPNANTWGWDLRNLRNFLREFRVGNFEMHSIFQEGYVSHAYKVTAKMAADIHTKSFRGLRFLDSCVSADQHLSACPHRFPGDHGFDASHSRSKR